MLLNQDAGTPLYRQLAQQLLDGLRQGGAWHGEGALPSERTLSANLSVSRDTARRALNFLRERGLLTRKHGSGTYLAVGELGAPTATRMRWLSRETVLARPEELFVLGLPGNARVARLTGLALGTETDATEPPSPTPQALEISTVPLSLLPDLQALHGPLETHLAARGHSTARILQRLRAVNATPEQATLLGLAPGDALLHTTRIAYGNDGTALALTHSHGVLGCVAELKR